MKGKWRHLGKNRSGTIRLTPEDNDDIWHLYNIISVGDEVESVTIRKVQLENSAGNNVDSQKMKLVLAVVAEKMEVDLVAGCLRVNGRNVKENKHVKLGSYHTLELECNRSFKLSKEAWDPLSLEIIRESTSESGKYDVAAVILQEGLAHICTVLGGSSNDGSNVRVLKRIEENFPKKRIGSAYEKSVERFYSNVIEGLLEVFDFPALKAIILASPGNFREELHKRLLDLAIKKEDKKFILDARSKFIKVQVSSGQLGALQESLQEPRIQSLLENTKSAQELKLLDAFHKLHANSSEMTEFAWDNVWKAAQAGAIKHLLLSDSLFRSLQVKERKKYIELVDEVRENGGSVQVFVTGSSCEVELSKISGVAAILNFPIQ